jgi:hypothetical protein
MKHRDILYLTCILFSYKRRLLGQVLCYNIRIFRELSRTLGMVTYKLTKKNLKFQIA